MVTIQSNNGGGNSTTKNICRRSNRSSSSSSYCCLSYKLQNLLLASLLILSVIVLTLFPRNNNNNNETIGTLLQQPKQPKQQQQQHQQHKGGYIHEPASSGKTTTTIPSPIITKATGGLRGSNNEGLLRDISIELVGKEKEGLRKDLLETLQCEEDDNSHHHSNTVRSGIDIVCQLALSKNHQHYNKGHDVSKLAAILRIWKEARTNLSIKQIIHTLTNAKERQFQIMTKTSSTTSSSTSKTTTTTRRKSSSSFTPHILDIWIPSINDNDDDNNNNNNNNAEITNAIHKINQQGADYGITQYQGSYSSSSSTSSSSSSTYRVLPLGVHKLFVDVGAQWGITSLSVLYHYPATKVICLESNKSHWLLLHINILWNVNHQIYDRNVLILPGGLGTHDGQSMSLQSWKPITSSTSLSSSSKVNNNKEDDDDKYKTKQQHQADQVHEQDQDEPENEQLVYLWTLSTIRQLAYHHLYLTQRNVHIIDLLKLDCEGCEYHIIPNLTQNEKQSIKSIVLGSEIHGHHLLLNNNNLNHNMNNNNNNNTKKALTKSSTSSLTVPSIEIQNETHEFLCQYQAFATFVECCNYTQLVLVDDDDDNNNKDNTPSRTMGEIMDPTLCE